MRFNRCGFEQVAPVGRFLALDMSDEAAAAVARKFDRDQVRRLVAEAEREARAKRQRGERFRCDEVFPSMDGTTRARQAQTGFQTNHIMSRGADEWRSTFTPDQIARLNAVAGAWLERHAYSV